MDDRERLPGAADALEKSNAAFEAIGLHRDATVGEFERQLESAGLISNHDTVMQLGKTLADAGLIFSKKRVTPVPEAALKQLSPLGFDRAAFSNAVTALGGALTVRRFLE